jgi:uncharacterized protein
VKSALAALALLSAAACAKADSRPDGGAERSDGALLPDAGGGTPRDASSTDAEPHGSSTPVINEFVADHAGNDACEYVEIAGAAGADYSNHTVLTVEGDAGNNPGQVQAVIPVGSMSGAGLWDSGFLPANLLQNGSSTILLVADFAGGTPDIDGNDDGAIDSEPWSALVDAVAVNDAGSADLTYAGDAVLTRTWDGANSVVGGASRIPDGTDTDQPADWVRNLDNAAGLTCENGAPDAGEAQNTPGAPNHR